MSFNNLADFGGYRKSLELFDLVVEDTGRYMKSARCERLVSQQIASADSVCSNIEPARPSRSRVARGSGQCEWQVASEEQPTIFLLPPATCHWHLPLAKFAQNNVLPGDNSVGANLFFPLPGG
jgi:hypothetical protein